MTPLAARDRALIVALAVLGAYPMAKAGETRYPRNAARLGVPRFDMLLGWAAAQAPSPLFVVERSADGRYRAVAELQP